MVEEHRILMASDFFYPNFGDNDADDEVEAINNCPNSEASVGKTSNRQSESTEGRDFVPGEQNMQRDSCLLAESCTVHDLSQLDQMTVHKLQDAFRNMFGRETKIRDKQWLKRRILFGIQNSGEVHRPLNSVGFGASTGENEGRHLSTSGMESCVASPCSPEFTLDSETKVFKKIKESISDSSENYSSEGSEIGISFHCEVKDFGTVKGKRAHQPPRRYIKETITVEPRRISKKFGVSCKRPRDRLVDEKLPKPKEKKVNGNARSALQDGSFDGCIQVPYGLPVEEDNTAETASYKPLIDDVTPKGPRPTVSTLKRELENPPAKVPIIPKRPSSVKAQFFFKSPLPKLHVVIPQEEPVNRSPMQKGTWRRKHHISWTLSEVMRLIEGVSHLGVGRWSKIKGLLFTTSKHHTSVDLKDKWRNLVKCPSAQKEGFASEKAIIAPGS